MALCDRRPLQHHLIEAASETSGEGDCHTDRSRRLNHPATRSRPSRSISADASSSRMRRACWQRPWLSGRDCPGCFTLRRLQMHLMPRRSRMTLHRLSPPLNTTCPTKPAPPTRRSRRTTTSTSSASTRTSQHATCTRYAPVRGRSRSRARCASRARWPSRTCCGGSRSRSASTACGASRPGRWSFRGWDSRSVT